MPARDGEADTPGTRPCSIAGKSTMKKKRVNIRLFATLRERAHASEVTRDFPEDATVGQMWEELKREFPGLRGYTDSVGFAVNREYVEREYTPNADDEIAFIPPVSGGAGDAPWIGSIRITRERLDVAMLEATVADPAAGGMCTFVGSTREENAGRKVIRLEYEAYEAMALSEMRKLAEEAGRRWSIVRI